MPPPHPCDHDLELQIQAIPCCTGSFSEKTERSGHEGLETAEGPTAKANRQLLYWLVPLAAVVAGVGTAPAKKL